MWKKYIRFLDPARIAKRNRRKKYILRMNVYVRNIGGCFTGTFAMHIESKPCKPNWQRWNSTAMPCHAVQCTQFQHFWISNYLHKFNNALFNYKYPLNFESKGRSFDIPNERGKKLTSSISGSSVTNCETSLRSHAWFKLIWNGLFVGCLRVSLNTMCSFHNSCSLFADRSTRTT